ncbi:MULTISPECIES: MFS transporter [Streptomyces]|uniref:MFS transporter n=1 Tax=Streptomyces TaxID=1883 RepID=UPI0015EE6283|nr:MULTISPECIES: MFS transporter [Streptomyces]MCZ0997288.1 MFS transporter [Streptomyces mirabilis]
MSTDSATMTDHAAVRAMPLGEALDGAPMSRFHVRFWLLAGLGILLDGFDFFIIGVANPLVAKDFTVGSALQGLVSAAAIVGAMCGAALLGPLGDRIGRSRIFRLDLWMFVVFSVLCTLAWDAWSLAAFRFALGLAVGLDYPIAAGYLAEILPSKNRGRWLVGAFSLQAAGILLGAVVGVVVLNVRPEVDSWRIMLGFGVLPALLIIWLRRAVPESPRWLAQNGHEEEACEIGRALAGVPVTVTGADRERQEGPPEGLRAFLQPHLFSRRWRRRTIFTAVPWFLMDIATYGVGIFTPTLLASFALAGANSTFIADDIASTKGTAVLDVFLVIGFWLAIVLVDRVGRVPLQLTGFGVMALALCILAGSAQLPGGPQAHLSMVVVGFALFNTFMNLGPNSTTFTLPAEVFPSEMRAAGHGFATGCGKLGAALGTFLFPVLLARLGESLLLYGVAVTSALGFLVTYLFRIEPRGRSLQELSGLDAAALAPRITPP